MPRSRTGRSGTIQTQPAKFSVAGEGLNSGRDTGEPVTDDYPGTSPWAFTGTLHRVDVDVSAEPYLDLDREAVAMLSADRTSRTLPRLGPRDFLGQWVVVAGGTPAMLITATQQAVETVRRWLSI